MKREQQPDDVFVYGPNDWCYREDWRPYMGTHYWLLMTETPEWVHFMENVA